MKRSGTIPLDLAIYTIETMEFKQADVEGVPTYELAEQGKDDLDLMLTCCESEIKAFKDNNEELAPAPFYFERATILLKKEKKWEELIKVAEQYFSAIEEYKKKAKPYSAKVWLSPHQETIMKRLDLAYSRLKKEVDK